MKKLLFILLLTIPFLGFGQGWERLLNLGHSEKGNSVQQTTDGGYIICGNIVVTGIGEDLLLIKTDNNGIIQWNRLIGVSFDDGGFSVQQTTDGGYIITGWTMYSGNGYDVYLIKTDSQGDSLWTKTFDGTNSEWGNSVQQTTDGGYIICGSTQSFGNGNFDVWVIKTDGNGDSLWTKTFGGIDSDYGFSVQQTTDGGYIICGYSSSFGNGSEDVYLIKTDGSGNITSTFNIPISSNRKLNKVVDILGRDVKPQPNTPFIEIYDDGSTEKKIVVD